MTHSLKRSGERVLVAGGAGFVGSAVVRTLAAQGAAVTVYDSCLHGTPDNVSDVPGVTFVRGDVNDTDLLRRTLGDGGFRYVIDCVGDTFVPDAYADPARFLRNNVDATLSLLTAARAAAVERLVYLSTTEVYGESAGSALGEEHAFDPLNTYAVTKLAADRLCFAAALEHEQDVVIARLFNTFGPRETHPYIVPEVIRQLTSSAELTLGDLTAERDFTYVDDTADAICRLLDVELEPGEAFNIGTGHAYPMSWLVETLATIMGVPDWSTRLDPGRLRRREISSFVCDAAKLRRRTGWSPATSIEDGLRRTVEWYLRHGRSWHWEAQQATADAVPGSALVGR